MDSHCESTLTLQLAGRTASGFDSSVQHPLIQGFAVITQDSSPNPLGSSQSTQSAPIVESLRELRG